MNPIELTAAVLILLNVALVARRSILNYPVAIAGVALYAFVFAEARLYSDMLLQGFFLVLNVYGWINWRRSRELAGEVVVQDLGAGERRALVLGTVAAIFAWGTLMHRLTDASYPWWDAGVAILSVAAQWMQARRFWESWLLWIAVDLMSIGLYAAKELWATMGLYVILTGLAGWGLIAWHARGRSRTSTGSVA